MVYIQWDFILDYSLIVSPLTGLTKKGVEFVWSVDCEKAFVELKRQFKTADICRHFNQQLPIILETDASDFAISGILLQEHRDGVHPVGFYSRKLRTEELNYDTHDKELLAIVESFKAWRHFTMETLTPVKVLSDHNNLKYFMTSKNLNRRQ
ncbi:putative gag/polymerase/env polyprotein, partial [Planoprotostelium fungivorum]